MAGFTAWNAPMQFSQGGTFADAAHMNQQLYSNIQAAHANRIAQTGAAQQQLQGGYSNLSNAVLMRLAGSNRANIQDINDKYTAMMGSVQSQLIARGLGNTSILGDLARGVSSDRAKEVTRSRGQFAQLMGGYQSQIGLAGLGAQGQGIGLMAGLQGDQINSLERVSAPYPSGGSGMPMGMPGPGAPFSPTGGPGPRSAGFYGGGAIDFSGGGGGGGGDFGGWATGYGGGGVGGGYGAGDGAGVVNNGGYAVGGVLGGLLAPGVYGNAQYAAGGGNSSMADYANLQGYNF